MLPLGSFLINKFSLYKLSLILAYVSLRRFKNSNHHFVPRRGCTCTVLYISTTHEWQFRRIRECKERIQPAENDTCHLTPIDPIVFFSRMPSIILSCFSGNMDRSWTLDSVDQSIVLVQSCVSRTQMLKTTRQQFSGVIAGLGV